MLNIIYLVFLFLIFVLIIFRFTLIYKKNIKYNLISFNYKKLIIYFLYFFHLVLIIFLLNRNTNFISNFDVEKNTLNRSIILLDVSTSMLSDDAKPNRLAFAIDKINEYLNESIDDEFSLVLFSSEISIVVPFTFDKNLLKNYLYTIKNITIENMGSRPIYAITKIMKYLEQFNFKKNIKFLIFSDFEQSNDDLNFSKLNNIDNKIKFFLFPIGKNEKSFITIEENDEKKYLMNSNNERIETSLNTLFLKNFCSKIKNSKIIENFKSLYSNKNDEKVLIQTNFSRKTLILYIMTFYYLFVFFAFRTNKIYLYLNKVRGFWFMSMFFLLVSNSILANNYFDQKENIEKLEILLKSGNIAKNQMRKLIYLWSINEKKPETLIAYHEFFEDFFEYGIYKEEDEFELYNYAILKSELELQGLDNNLERPSSLSVLFFLLKNTHNLNIEKLVKNAIMYILNQKKLIMPNVLKVGKKTTKLQQNALMNVSIDDDQEAMREFVEKKIISIKGKLKNDW